MNPLFFLFISLTILAYGIQGPLMVGYTRRYDGLSVTAISRTSLIVTMFPLLLLAGFEEVVKIFDYVIPITFASLIGAVAYVLTLEAARDIQIGVSGSIRQGVYVGFALLLGILFLQEIPSLTQSLILILIVISIILLSLSKQTSFVKSRAVGTRGISLSVLAGFGFALSFYFFSIVSREVDPIVATYFWMFGIAIVSLCIIFIKSRTLKFLLAISLKDFFGISLVSVTTIVGTVSYGYAVNYGFFALASGLAATSTVISALGGRVLFKELMTRRQVVLIGITILLIVLLRLVS